MTSEVVRAAGGVVTRPAPGSGVEVLPGPGVEVLPGPGVEVLPGPGVEVLVVHRPRYDDWSLPKGKAEPGERDEDTARREVEEETGYRCALGEELATVRYQDRRGRDKQVRFWHMTVVTEGPGQRGEQPAFVPNDEVDECRWISPAVAATLLTYDADRRLLRSLGGTDVGPATPH